MSGLRRGEICALMWRDFDSKAGTLKISRTLHSKGQGIYALGDTKTSQGNRTIILPESVAALLRARKKISISQWIFPQPPAHQAGAGRDSAEQADAEQPAAVLCAAEKEQTAKPARKTKCA